MRNQRGKMNFTTLIMTLVVFYAGFVAVQFILAGVTRGQIKTDIKSKISVARGGFTMDIGRKIIEDVLFKHDVIFDPEVHKIHFEFGTIERRHKIIYRFEYEMEVNLLLFKTKPKLVRAEDRIGRFGL